jgi:hypothetical protein
MGLPDRQPHLVSKPVGGDWERVRILCLTPNLPGPLRLISGSRPVPKATFREEYFAGLETRVVVCLRSAPSRYGKLSGPTRSHLQLLESGQRVRLY